jgi:hypothetical protein
VPPTNTPLVNGGTQGNGETPTEAPPAPTNTPLVNGGTQGNGETPTEAPPAPTDIATPTN